ncbi:MAG TPA: cytochrome c peroxidase [Gemmatimonadaceae bacterium]|nr:cytochrome c peroxidase [Gemmatimonadaceae bacterium]
MALRRADRARRGLVVIAAAAAFVCACSGSDAVQPEDAVQALRSHALAAGLAPMPDAPPRPVDNPYNADRVALGRLLFFDPILSGPRNVACSTCHLPRFAFGDGRQFPVGAGATGLGPARTLPSPPPLRPMPRNAPTVMNVGLFGHLGPDPSVNGTMFWGADAFGLDDQVLGPISNDNEMRGLVYSKIDARDSVLARLRAIPGYVTRFAAAYPDIAHRDGTSPDQLITSTTLRHALAAYLRELVTPHAPLDDFLEGDDHALTAAEQRGMALFIGKANCVACHRGPLLSDFTPHVLGVAQVGLGRDSTPGDDIGWGEHGGTPYAFRTPSLRQVTLTAPYFHDGVATTLQDVLEFKNRGTSAYDRVPASALDPAMHPLGLATSEMTDLLAFFHALTDSVSMQDSLFRAPAAVPSGLAVVQ